MAELKLVETQLSTFDQFWSIYPRRVAKKVAQTAWNRLTDVDRRLALYSLPSHVKLWLLEGREQCMIPHAGSWLNGERFHDEIELPEPTRPDWWKTQSGILAKGASMQLSPRPGESISEFRGRIEVALK